MDNTDRANHGAAAIKSGSHDFEKNGVNSMSDLEDTLANLMHYARVQSLDFQHAVTMAEIHFEEETCATTDCMNDAGNGEGFDGYCGECADKREASK